MRVLVCGGRDYENWEEFRNEMEKIALERFPRTEPDEYGNYLYAVHIIHGGARGADSLADQWAVINWCPFTEYKAEWDKYGRSAGPRRNIKMVREGKPDLVIAFPGGKGTAHMVSFATEEGIEVIDLRYKLRTPKIFATEVRHNGGTVP